MTPAPMHPVRFWLLFLVLVTVAILFAGSFSAASAAGKVPRATAKKTINKPIVKKPTMRVPTIKIGTAYVAELRHK